MAEQMRLVCIIPAEKRSNALASTIIKGGGWDTVRVSFYDPEEIHYICNWRSADHARIYTKVRELGGKAYYLGDAPAGKAICSSADGDEETSACKLYSPNLVMPEQEEI